MLSKLLAPSLVGYKRTRFNHGKSTYSPKISKMEKRFQECLLPVISRSLTFGFGVYAVHDKEWLYDGELLYDGWPYEQGQDCCIADIKLIYMAHIGWYVYKIFGQTFLDRHLKDYYVTMLHHFIAIILLSLSYTHGMFKYVPKMFMSVYNFIGFVRVGMAVLLLHDPADIMIGSGKLFRLARQPILTNITFVILIIGWFVTRIVLYPYHAILPTLQIGLYGADNVNADTRPVLWAAVFCCILYCLHLHWTWFLIQVVIRILNGKGSKDPRSEEDDIDEEEKEG